MDLIADDPVAFGVSDVYRAELKAMVAQTRAVLVALNT